MPVEQGRKIEEPNQGLPAKVTCVKLRFATYKLTGHSTRMTANEFESLLTTAAKRLSDEIQDNSEHRDPSKFESRARAVILELAKPTAKKVDLAPHSHIFPDIVVDEFGIEVKVTDKDSWRSIANSVFEGTRDINVKHVYVLFGKMSGTPEVRWGRYEDCVIHVRTSHVPRFEVDLTAEQSLFSKFGVSYEKFRQLNEHEKMAYIRQYARGRLKKDERLWWLEDKPEPEQEHSLPLEVRLYMRLSQEEKRRLRAEAAILCPQIVKPSRSRSKYNDATLYLLTYHGVLCPQARDLFSAGSVALRSDETRGGIYILRALKDIEDEMREVAGRLEDALFVEYWGASFPAEQRIKEWLRRADGYARGWLPSNELF
jgi:hypothetical protein